MPFPRSVTSVILTCLLGAHVATHAMDDRRRWVDAATGRQVVKVTPEPYATLPYFTANSVSADGKFMVYISGKGLNLLALDNFSTENIVAAGRAELRVVEMGRKTNRLFYMKKQRAHDYVTLESIDLITRVSTVHAQLPPGYQVESINADESLAAGILEQRTAEQSINPRQPVKRGAVLYERSKQKIPMTLFTVDLSSAAVNRIYQSTEWLSHPQFSPVDPALLMYSIEGPWHEVDRLWTIRADGTQRRLIHKRTMEMEIAGHEFWSKDGKEILYDWQYPKGAAFYLASYNVDTGHRRAIPLDRSQWSVHFNASLEPGLFVGDGADRSQVARAPDSSAIILYRTQAAKTTEPASGLIEAPVIKTEKLVDLRGHDYRLEPNARLTPNNDWVVFRSNMFGTPAVFAVEVNKTSNANLEPLSTYELSKKIRSERTTQFME